MSRRELSLHLGLAPPARYPRHSPRSNCEQVPAPGRFSEYALRRANTRLTPNSHEPEPAACINSRSSMLLGRRKSTLHSGRNYVHDHITDRSRLHSAPNYARQLFTAERHR
ncbi:hypothetical protein BV898_16595 [Hypsibius exemplaris]|uniref:Uncharacterized protein n=1 Tax=Hypsibius exemplaris TaxID=2072580 RepID=A0A9X6NMA0_HYPEX|nr:hypothetical protein BV898_16595 [Hypsibius exemplaris]